MLSGVPAVWELIRKGIEGKVRAGGGLKEKVFNSALAAKRSSRLLFGGLTDAIVFNKVKEATGGKLQFALSGGAGISKATQEFLEMTVVQCVVALVPIIPFGRTGIAGSWAATD